MTEPFRALVVEKSDGGQSHSIRMLTEDELMPGDVTVKVAWSTINYKDGLAVTGAAPVVRRSPMIPGIDLAGEVVSSGADAIKVGDKVIVNGWGLGETHFGGYAGRARLEANMITPLPKGITGREAMAVGTAGYTAALCVLALLDQGVKPDQGPVLVTGAAGGVGSVSIALLAAKGFEVLALTGRPEEAGYLKDLGAKDIIPRADLAGDPKPLAKERFAGAVDAVGSKVLANVLSQIKYGGAVAACGLAGGMDLPTSVAPFILRGVKLIGIESVYAPQAVRARAWDLIARDLDKAKLAAMTEEIALDDVPARAEQILAGKVRGRLVVKIGG